MSHPFASYPGGNRIRRLQDINFAGKRVFLRVDFNVPMEGGKITDDTRIRAAMPTLEFLFSKGARVICASHLGRPKGKNDPKYSLHAVAERLGELTGKDVIFSDDCVGQAVVAQTKTLKDSQVMLLENLRFHEGEEKNSQDFTYKLSQLCDVYVNDAFGTCHRAHASTAGLPALMKERAASSTRKRNRGSFRTHLQS